MKKSILLILIALTLIGCGKTQPPPSPRYQNFALVKVTVSGDKAQVLNNSLEYDRNKGSWLVQIKMEKQSTIGRMARKLLGNADVKNGLLTQTLYEDELELWKDK
jgi:hypothetical protein